MRLIRNFISAEGFASFSFSLVNESDGWVGSAVGVGEILDWNHIGRTCDDVNASQLIKSLFIASDVRRELDLTNDGGVFAFCAQGPLIDFNMLTMTDNNWDEEKRQFSDGETIRVVEKVFGRRAQEESS